MSSSASQHSRTAKAHPPADAAETIESYDYRARASARPRAIEDADSSPVLTGEGELERAAAQLASVFPGFLSVAHASALHSGFAAAEATDTAAGSRASGTGTERDREEADSYEPPLPVESTELWQQGWQAGVAQGREEGMLAARDAFTTAQREDADAALLAARQQVLQAIQEFAAERERYYHDLEQEAVRLALAIAARILRREAQMDPLLLSGAVRVALGQLGESTSVRLVVPEADRSLWEESLRLTPGLRLRPEVIGDARMELGECRIQTDFGGADLSLHEQLREIERGFFDRLPQRGVPEAAAPVRPATEEAATGAGQNRTANPVSNSAPVSPSVSAPVSASASASVSTSSAAAETAAETDSALSVFAGVPR